MPEWALFTNNGRGFSFEVQDACVTDQTPVSCMVGFDNTREYVTRFGNYSRKQFPSDPDLAGAGVSR